MQRNPPTEFYQISQVVREDISNVRQTYTQQTTDKTSAEAKADEKTRLCGLTVQR